MIPLFSNEIETEVRAQLERLLSARSFVSSERQSRLLRYLVEEALAGKGAMLKESVVGVDVFGKPVGYDPKVDSTVRSEVVKLRTRLADHYDTEGVSDPWLIRVPKGTYVPAFERKAAAPAVAVPAVTRRKLPAWLLAIPAAAAVVAVVELWPARHERRSLAVLPFRLLNPGTEHEYLGIGMADALITRLTNQQQITIRPTSRILGYANSDPVQAGRKLQVDYVLEGTLRTDNGRLRLNIQLVNVDTGAPRWGSTFDENLTDLFRVEDSLSRQVAEALAAHLTASERNSVGQPLTTDPEAHRLFLQGRYEYSRFNERGAMRAIELFRMATQRDPRFAHAWAGIAETILNSCVYHWSPALLGEARQSAQRAVDLNAGLAEAHISLALSQWFYDWNWPAAEATFQKAIKLNPAHPRGPDWYGQYLSQMGRFAEGRRGLARAIELDPGDPVLKVNLALIDYYEDKYEQAARAQELVVTMDGGFYPALIEAGRSWQMAGQTTRAVALLERARAVDDTPWTRLLIARAQKSRGALESVEKDTSRYVSPAMLAMVYEALGDHDRGIDLIEEAVRERSPWITFLKVDPAFHGFRKHPRFQRILQRVGL